MIGNRRSLAITSVATKLFLAFLLILCPFAPKLMAYYDKTRVTGVGNPSIYNMLLFVFYAAVVFAVFAMLALIFILRNIKNNQLFVYRNKALLTVISYMTFAEGFLFLIFATVRPLSVIIFFAAMFFGLVLRVLRNIFARAIELQEESDYTV